MTENFGYDIICALVDVGRMKDLETLRLRGLDAGAVESVIVDAKEEFLTDFAFEALKANALYEGKYPCIRLCPPAHLEEDGRARA